MKIEFDLCRAFGVEEGQVFVDGCGTRRRVLNGELEFFCEKLGRWDKSELGVNSPVNMDFTLLPTYTPEQIAVARALEVVGIHWVSRDKSDVLVCGWDKKPTQNHVGDFCGVTSAETYDLPGFKIFNLARGELLELETVK